ncbi:glycosyltransferase family 2 protein [Thermodesulfobacteriota bacterium]
MKVSVIIPTFNRPGYLVQAVHSVLQQTHPVFEIIIVDDGSSIPYRTKIDALKQLDGRISVFHLSKNKGVSAARNYGLQKSQGDYILFLDDDDLLHPDMVESNLRILADDSEAGVVSSGYGMFFDETSPDTDWSIEHQHAMFPETTFFSWDYEDTSMLTEHPFSALLRKSLQVSSCLLSKKAIGSVRFPEDLTRGEDSFFWLSLASSGCCFRINHSQLGFYRLHRYNSLSGPGWRKASLENKLKILHQGIATKQHDRLVVHLHLARILLQFDRLQSLKHICFACRILILPSVIPFWPLLFKSILGKFYNRYRHRKVHKARRVIIAGNTNENWQ